MLFPKSTRHAFVWAGSLLAALSSLPMHAALSRHASASSQSHHRHTAKAGKTRGSHGATSSHPRAIDDARATEIQGALVKAGYLQTASGHWDTASADAMRKMQADNGWQTKLIPDSRALIKLGLGAGSTGAAPSVPGTAGATE